MAKKVSGMKMPLHLFAGLLRLEMLLTCANGASIPLWLVSEKYLHVHATDCLSLSYDSETIGKLQALCVHKTETAYMHFQEGGERATRAHRLGCHIGQHHDGLCPFG